LLCSSKLHPPNDSTVHDGDLRWVAKIQMEGLNGQHKDKPNMSHQHHVFSLSRENFVCKMMAWLTHLCLPSPTRPFDWNPFHF
jgi:hypothetical protein